MQIDSYSALKRLMMAYFHQDFELDGDVPTIIERFALDVGKTGVVSVHNEILCFLVNHRHDADDAFHKDLNAEVNPAGWGMTARQWLEWIDRMLLQATNV